MSDAALYHVIRWSVAFFVPGTSARTRTPRVPARLGEDRSGAEPGKGLRCAPMNAYGALARTHPLPWEVIAWPENCGGEGL
jgi:hypothetical protein